MNNEEEEVDLVPWLRDRIMGLRGEGLRRILMGKGFESPDYQTTPGTYLVEVDHIETLYQLVGWVGDHLDPCIKVRGVWDAYVAYLPPERFLKVPTRFLQIVSPEATKGYILGIDWAEPNSEESIVTYYKGVDNIPVFRPPKSFVCTYGGQSLTFNEVVAATDGEGREIEWPMRSTQTPYVVCPTTGRKLNPHTLLPIEESVDFTTRSIL